MFFPVVIIREISGANGRNWPGIVMLDPRSPRLAAVLAQEAWEAEHKLNPVNLIRTRFSDAARRDMELMGHEAEVQAAAVIYGLDPAAYRLSEAQAMHRGYGGLFADLPPDVIAAQMKSCTLDAAAWVRKRLHRLTSYKTI